MLGSTGIIKFKVLPLKDKFKFFEDVNNTLLRSFNPQELNNFFREIILDELENSNIRKKALETFIDCVFLGKIKIRQCLNLLIDDWNNNSDVFLKLQRLKDLQYFYTEEENEIELIFQNHLNEDEAEIVSEAYINLGLIYMQKGFSSVTQEETLMYLTKSETYLSFSYNLIENRIDALFYKIVVSIVINGINGLLGNMQQNLKAIAEILFHKEAFSFDYIINSFYLGFYRALISMHSIVQETPYDWLDYRLGLTKLYTKYSEITNQVLKDRLNQSVLSSSFVSMLKSQFIEPYFALNFHSQISKINSRLLELDSKSNEYEFLEYIKTLANNQDYKKKIGTNSIRQSFINIFPQRSLISIDETLLKVRDDKNPFELLNAITELQKPTVKDFTDKLVFACVKLQGNRLYRGDFSEDDRNTFIANILESTGYIAKDQTRWSKSVGGKAAGEIDILVQDKKGFPFAIIEALNLGSLKKDYTILHIDKIFNYDTTGLECNFILVYSSVKNFSDFWSRYVSFISTHIYYYDFLSFEKIDDYMFADFKIGKAKHLRNGMEIFLYHIMVDLH